MTLEVQAWKKKRRRLWFALGVLLVLLAVVVMPSLISINRYKGRITQLLSESLGRPVRLSSVELRLLPVPGFVLTDLTVQEDPAYGAEPVLHANTVTASIRLLSLLSGHVRIGTISVDEASLNVVRTADGRWNLDPLFRTAAAKAQPVSAPGRRELPLPYLEATNSRINFKRGAEKLPFSLVETDLSFWQEQPGDWRIRLRGQPARTDVNLDLADTGIVRLEARAQRAAELRQMPIHVDLEWNEAQLGQLARLLTGSDPGWRGDLTGEIHIDGTAEAAQVKTRLRATGVHRAEFAPAAPMDFDASCSVTYHYPAGALEGLLCDSPLGDGHMRLSGAVPANGKDSHLSVELDRIPVAAGLDALRTVRSGINPGLEANGLISGKITYAPVDAAPAPVSVGAAPAAVAAAPARLPRARGKVAAKARPAEPGPLTGSFIVQNFGLSGGGLSTPLQAAKVVLEPVVSPAPVQAAVPAADSHTVPRIALETTVSLPADGPTPLTVTATLARTGYEIAIKGPASVARAKELAKVAGIPQADALDALAGEPITVDLSAAGPWMPAAETGTVDAGVSVTTAAPAVLPVAAVADQLHGTVTLHNVNWKAGFLSNPVSIAQATLHLDQGAATWSPVVFSYGPLKGSATLAIPARCDAVPACPPGAGPTFTLQFGQLDASQLQAALVDTQAPGTLLSTLIDRFRPAGKPGPVWPAMQGTVKADSFVLGPVTLTSAVATVKLDAAGAEITALNAGLLGGQAQATGLVSMDQGKPVYAFSGAVQKLNPAQVSRLAGTQGTGRSFKAEGKLELSGLTGKELAASAKGSFTFDWERGTVSGAGNVVVPAALVRFDRWSGDADLSGGLLELKNSQVQLGSHKSPVDAQVTLGDPAKASFPVRASAPAAKTPQHRR